MTPWLTLDIGGQKWRVSILGADEAPPPEMLGKEGVCEGVCLHEEGMIYIREMPSKPRMYDALIHELLHAVIDTSGIGTLLSNNMKRGSKWDELEEQLVRILTPHIITTLRNARLLKGRLPPIPQSS